MTFNDTHDEYLSISLSHKLYYEPLHTIEKYTLLKYTIFQLKIISDL